ncbi:hypothetical protein SB48_HM08orf00159 [Heyndrickxia coagulans]|uniref:Uncharacterized protein n=1 Tax=Heyndrickxia coagulans TaxID=1398 RepID=A0AAN0T1R0_HEYCO|nr:hypothetical protein SB48_HM08orf00159 [Heyndrickxia coagulans]
MGKTVASQSLTIFMAGFFLWKRQRVQCFLTYKGTSKQP